MKRNRRRKFPVLVAVLTSIMLISGGVLVVQAESRNSGSASYEKCYKTIQVQSGDTLWGLAGKYRTDKSSSIYEYMDEIRSINKLDGEYLIAGTKLLIVYYREKNI